MNQGGYVLDLIIKKHSNDKKIIMPLKYLKTNLPVLYVYIEIKKMSNYVDNQELVLVLKNITSNFMLIS